MRCECGPCRRRQELDEAAFFLSGAGFDTAAWERKYAAIPPCEVSR